jgi:lipoate-protein ligase A
MALDHSLLYRARETGESVLRVYGWSVPVLSLGRNQRARGIYDDAALARRNIEVVRRPTGGRALLHHREITYSVTAPYHGEMSVASVYGRINLLLINALHALGVPAEIAAPATRAPGLTAAPCFAEPSAGEIVLHGRKLAGSAQWRDGGALLQHGSVLIEDDQHEITALMREPMMPAPPPATLHAAMGRAPTIAEFADALFHAVRSLEDADAELLRDDDALLARASTLERTYADPADVWRR